MTHAVDDVPGGYSWDAVRRRLAIIARLEQKKRELIAIKRTQEAELYAKACETDQAKRTLVNLSRQLGGQAL